MSIDTHTEGICPQCKRPKIVALHGGLCYEHAKSVRKAKKVADPIAKEGEKQGVVNRAYSILAKAFKAKNPICQAQLVGCTKLTTDVHHKKGRGIYQLDENTFLAVCRHCHDEIGAKDALAKALGLSASRLSKTENES